MMQQKQKYHFSDSGLQSNLTPAILSLGTLLGNFQILGQRVPNSCTPSHLRLFFGTKKAKYIFLAWFSEVYLEHC